MEVLIQKAKPEVIYHFAGQVAMTSSIENPYKDFEINVGGTLNVLEAVRKMSPMQRYFTHLLIRFMGIWNGFDIRKLTVAMWPQIFPMVLLKIHNWIFIPHTDVQKVRLINIYWTTPGYLKTAVFRHSSTNGGRQYSTYDQGWIGWFCREALMQAKGKASSTRISGNGKQVRDLLHAQDMVALYLRAGERIQDIAGHAFNMGGGII